jgi:hypothetical protein
VAVACSAVALLVQAVQVAAVRQWLRELRTQAAVAVLLLKTEVQPRQAVLEL